MSDAFRPGRFGRLRLVLWAMVALAAIGFAYLQFRDGQPAGRQENYSAAVGGPFALISPDGSTVTERTLRGRPFALFFGFTRCPDVCPTTLARLVKLRRDLASDGEELQIVFVSVDPEADKPDEIGRYIGLFGAPIIGLTGTPEQVAQIAKAYGVYYSKAPQEGDNYTIDHTATVFLMDRDGRLQSTLDMKESDEASLSKLRRLVD